MHRIIRFLTRRFLDIVRLVLGMPMTQLRNVIQEPDVEQPNAVPDLILLLIEHVRQIALSVPV